MFTTDYIVLLVLKLTSIMLKDAVNFVCFILQNATFQKLVIYASRRCINSTLWLIYYVIGSLDSNPMIKIVEKEIKEVPKSSIMKLDKHDSTKSALYNSAKEMKVLSMSFMTVILTWVIKGATTARRSLIGSITETRKTR